jgi:DNA polymerase-3 subunit beta
MKSDATVRYHFLKAARKIAASMDIRYYLNGVLIEIGEQETRYVATDGHGLIVIKDGIGGVPFQIIVPNEVIDMLPAKTPSPAPTLTYDPERPRAECRIGDVMFTPTDGKFPEYRKIIPTEASKEWAQIQPRYLIAFHEAARIAFPVTNAYLEFWPNGEKGVCLVTLGREDFAGAVMPFRPDGTPQFAQWAQRDLVAA